MAQDATRPSGKWGRDRSHAIARPRHTLASGPAQPPSRPNDQDRISGRPCPGRPLKEDVRGLERLSRSELRAVWTKELGDQPPATLGRDLLALGIAYARQERRQGGLTKPVARELDRLLEQIIRGGRAEKPTVAVTPALPRNGTVLVRGRAGV